MNYKLNQTYLNGGGQVGGQVFLEGGQAKGQAFARSHPSSVGYAYKNRLYTPTQERWERVKKKMEVREIWSIFYQIRNKINKKK